MRIFSNRLRPVHLGAFPLERLPRAPIDAATLRRARGAAAAWTRPAAPGNALARICREYARLYEGFRAGPVAPERAPVPDDPAARAKEFKALGIFLDASLAGACAVPDAAWIGGTATATMAAPLPGHTHALVFVVEEGSAFERDNPVHDLIAGSGGAAAKLRATDIAVILSATLRRMGFQAVAHSPEATDVSLPVLAVQAGLARLRPGGGGGAGPGDTELEAPFIGRRFAVSAVTTDMALAPDAPLAPRRRWRRLFEGGSAWWLGRGGATTWWERRALRRRPGEWGRYRMERVRRVPEATTVILHDEVPRMAKRSNGFVRAMHGDLGDKAQREVTRFAGKTPLADATRVLIAAQQPYQDGKVADAVDPAFLDARRNRRAVASLMHHLGADIAGACEAKRYAWYSHELDGTPIQIYHRSAAVLVLDQGFDTMEGASGDDWVSATQSMRAYFRGAQITGIVAAWLRDLGHSARSHTSIDSDVLHVPLLVLAGLGEMSRIGETVLNPFIGPRSKSAVVTTNAPLSWDEPIDFGLQDTCRKCMKCARECPCDAITYGLPVMFNGYEQWKQDVQRCTSYRITNQGGSACGRCMKTCPWNNEGLLVHRALAWAAIHLPWTRAPLARLDDWLGNGGINPVKRWWSDLEIVAGRVVRPAKVNRRELDRGKGFGLKDKQRISYTNADMLPAPNEAGAAPMDRKAGAAAGALLETPDQAQARVQAGGPTPGHYVPTPVRTASPDQEGQAAASAPPTQASLYAAALEQARQAEPAAAEGGR